MTVRRRQEEMLWRHSSQPLRQPLLKKLQNKEPQTEQAIHCYMDILSYIWLTSVTVGMLDLQSPGLWFDSWSRCYRVVSTWMGDCLRTGKPLVCDEHEGQLSLLSLRGT